MVIGEFASRVPHYSDIRIVETPTRTDAIEKKADLNSSPGTFAEGIAKLTADFIGMENVGRKVDRLLSGTNRLQHRGKIFVSIGEQFDPVSSDRDGIRKRQRRTEKFGIAHGEGMLEVIFQRMTAKEKNAEDQDHRQEAEAEYDPLGEREFPPALVQPM